MRTQKTAEFLLIFDDVNRWFLVSPAAGGSRFVFWAGDQFHVLLSFERSLSDDFSGSYTG